MAKKIKTEDIIKIPSKHIVFISDIHFGVNSSSEEWQENISDYFHSWFFPFIKKSVDEYPDLCLICLGDVFHDRKSIDIDVNNLCIDIFEELAKMLPCYIINGNHDLSKKTNLGNSSLRSLSNINNLYVIKEPMLMHFTEGRKIVSKIVAIPYLGDCNDENKVLVDFSKLADYALMHTDISNMKFDNGMTIVGAVDSEKFSGKIISGHIHKRQETEKVIYVGSPYQLTRGDIGNQKGIYILDLETGNMQFTPNEYSPVFQKIDITKFLNYSVAERNEVMKNSYTDIVVMDTDIDKYKMSDIYAVLNVCGAKRAQIHVVKTKTEISADKVEDIRELSIEELIESAIDQLPEIDDEYKNKLKSLSSSYYKNAMMQMQDM